MLLRKLTQVRMEMTISEEERVVALEEARNTACQIYNAYDIIEQSGELYYRFRMNTI